MQFDPKEYFARISAVRAELKRRDLSALLVFAQESHYYLTGYDSTGYLFFQVAVITADDTPITLLTRRPDLQQARETSVIEDVRIWFNSEDAKPALDLRAILQEKGLKNSRIGIELDTYGLTGANHAQVDAALADWCYLEDASDIVRRLRVRKSAAELAYVRSAAQLADNALLAMLQTARPGKLDTEITAAGLSEILRSGGDVPPAGPLVNSGPRALYGRSVCGAHRLGSPDQVTIEFAAPYRRYNVCIMRTAAVGEASQAQRDLFAVVREALEAMTDAVRPGRPLGEIDDAHRRVFDMAGHKINRYAACGYSLGATYRPSWMDVPPMLFSGNATPAEPGMVLFMHAMLPDSARGLAMSVGHTVLVTEQGCELLSNLPLEFPPVLAA
ncbi:Xaa-Pro peptidase family protein [Limibacillus sp. MBR-115]|jgi:Xaa-Pro dipeptidase|uniref:M24 family metallopeptidase n=1 Tax=Limibacillus sp. MBR-115 TaxID=3156465 RepID=UPI0033976E50